MAKIRLGREYKPCDHVSVPCPNGLSQNYRRTCLRTWKLGESMNALVDAQRGASVRCCHNLLKHRLYSRLEDLQRLSTPAVWVHNHEDLVSLPDAFIFSAPGVAGNLGADLSVVPAAFGLS